MIMRRRFVDLALVAIAAAALYGCSSQSSSTPFIEPSASNGIGSPSAPATDVPRIGTMATLVELPVSVENNAGTVGTYNYAGQSITMPAGASYASIRFSWYRGRPGFVPTAFGRLYVLDRPYIGLPLDLSPATPGVLGRSEPQPTSGIPEQQGSEYELPETVTLVGGATYWFYTDRMGHFSSSFDEDVYSGGQMFLTGTEKLPFHAAQAASRMVNGVLIPPPPGVTTDANFRLRGIAR